MSAQKRDDIQWLRALAIFAVLFFHIWPHAFPNGYLGVDIFFVISGFLMASILSRSEINLESIKEFYFRRIKRIFPVYLLALSVTLAAGKFFLINSYFDDLKKEENWAVLFATNIKPMIHKVDYFDMISEYKFLLHTWSLGVEIQFYLIAPLIFFLLPFFNKNWALGIIIFASFTFQCLIPSEAMAFNFLVSRIWQFLIGALAFFQQDSHNYQILNDCDSENPPMIIQNHYNFKQIANFAALISIVAFPNFYAGKFTTIGFRLISTFFAYLFILQHSPNFGETKLEFPISQINAIFVYFGNLSYSLYLIHWPVIVFAKYFGYLVTLESSLTILFAIFMVTIIFYELIETFLGKRSDLTNAVLIFGLYISLTGFLVVADNKQSLINLNSLKPKTTQEKINMNQLMSKYAVERLNCKPDKVIKKYYTPHGGLGETNCSCKLSNSNVKKEAVLLGNSYAGSNLYGISAALKQNNFTKVYVFHRASCLPHGGLINKEFVLNNYHCDQWYHDAFQKFLNYVRPEIILVAGRLNNYKSLLDPLPSNLSADFGVMQFSQQLKKLSMHTKHLIVISPNPDVSIGWYKMNKLKITKLRRMLPFQYINAASIAKSLALGKSIKEFILPLAYVYEITHLPEVRLIEAMKTCSNCQFLNSTEIFCNSHGCPLYDEETELALLADQAHVSVVGSMKYVKPLLKLLTKLNF